MFDLLSTNMSSLYELSEWGWDAEAKLKELSEPDARYYVVVDPKKSAGDAGVVCAFSHFRFLVEEEVEVVYIYELQVAPAYQRAGLGKWLMMLLELTALKYKMRKTMLTTFKFNTKAMVKWRNCLIFLYTLKG